MKLPRRKARVVLDTLAGWERDGTLAPGEAVRLSESVEVLAFDWQRLARLSFWFAVACIVVAVASVLADDALMGLLRTLFGAPAAVKAAGLAVLAAALYAAGLRRRRAHPERRLGNEAVLFLGVLATAGAIGFLGVALDTGSGRISVLLLLAALVYATLGFFFPSTLVWVFALLSLGSWLGTETGYRSEWGALYLGTGYPLRFAVFGALLLGLARGLRSWRRGRPFAHATRVVALLYLFVSLWLLSIFGNYGDLDLWRNVPQLELLPWALLLGAASAVAIVHGLRRDDGVALGFGLVFLWINLYTRFFEYFWDELHGAVFFGVLGLSFWWLGSRAERIWTARGRLRWWHLFTGPGAEPPEGRDGGA